MELFNKNHNK